MDKPLKVGESSGAKRPLQIGDRIAIYGVDGNFKPIRRTATITGFDNNWIPQFSDEDSNNLFKQGHNGYDLTMSNPKSCRRLVKKPRRRRLFAVVPSYSVNWVSAAFDIGTAKQDPRPGSEIVEFIEVRRKK